ncbi:PAS domain S-box protein [Priestia abyssalis]|uniref:PAS domain S-box protein n=1 Tax=Priestia abyssalis TaxID=1221450 RepID=UPI001F3B8A57|nr:PAS domain S-box protein [Priestia abyssalis]
MQTTMKSSIQTKGYTVNANNHIKQQKVNILMVDDRPENLLALEAVLMSPHYHLVSANSGEEALKCVLKEDFAVILLDVQMPGMNGFETAKLIKARERSKNIPIIFITAISQDMEHVLHGYSVGAIDYIFKPFHPDTLKRKIEQFVKIHQNHEQLLTKSERERTLELEKINRKLSRTTLNLRKTEALNKVISETLMDTIITFDAEGYILSVNPAVEQMFGYIPHDLLDQHVTALLPAVEEDGTITSKGMVIETLALRKDNSSFPADIQIGEATIENHQIFVCSIRDVTERKQMEKVQKQQFNHLEMLVEERTLELSTANAMLKKEVEERRKIAENLLVSEERFRKVFESSPCSLAIRSAKDGRYIDVNSSWLKHTGYHYDEVKGEAADIVQLVSNSHRGKSYIRILELDRPVRNEKIRYITKEGEKRDALLSTEFIHIQDEACFLIAMTDITEQVLLEKEISRLDRLNLIGEMAAGIAHEIRNPMTTVRGFLQMGKHSGSDLSPEHIDLMMEELDRANSIIKEFLNLAKNKTSDKTKQELNGIIEALFPLIQAEALLSDKRVLLDLGTCPELCLDEKEIRQLVLNLSLNGLEAMSYGGTLTIKTYAEETGVVLEIEDQGGGINPDLLDKIGTPFFTTKENGTGLGLAICYSVADRHDAVIKVKTNQQGTVFSIHFKC